MKVRIPATIEEATTKLNGIDKLLTAGQWHRAAIVYACTTNNGRGNPHVNRGLRDFPMPIVVFARLGIKGLSETQVRAYREAWESAGGDRTIKPGDEVDLPTQPWKDHFGESTPDVQERVAKAYIAKNPKVVVESIKALPAVKDAVADHVAGDSDLRGEVEHRAFEKRMGRTYTGPSAPLVPPQPFNHNHEAQTLVFKLADALKQERDGVWTADGLTETLFRLLNITLDDRHKKEEPDIFDEINSHLATAAQEGAA